MTEGCLAHQFDRSNEPLSVMLRGLVHQRILCGRRWIGKICEDSILSIPWRVSLAYAPMRVSCDVILHGSLTAFFRRTWYVHIWRMP